MSISVSTSVAMLAFAGLVASASFASAQNCPASPSYSPDFSTQACMALNPSGSAYPAYATAQSSTSTVLRLTPNQGSLAASAWYSNQQVVSGGFSTTFSFQLGNPAGYDADGIAFVIQGSPSGTVALGPPGCGIGFGGSNFCTPAPGIPNSVAIEFNTYFNAGVDSSADSVSIQSCGSSANLVDPSCSLGSKDLTGKINLIDDAVHVATVVYTSSTLTSCGTSGTQSCSTLDVVLDGTDLFPGGVLFDMSSLGLSGTSAYVGFTAGTGGGNDYQDIVNWTFTPSGQSQTGTVSPGQTTPTTFNINGGFSAGSPTTGYDFTAQETTSTQTLQMVVTAIPMSQTACNTLVQANPLFKTAQCFIYQNGGGQDQDTSVLFEVTCPPGGSCGSSANPFNADLGTDFSFNCSSTENVPLACGPPPAPFSFGFPNLTSVDLLPSVGFLKGEGPDAIHPCTPNSGATPLFASNQIESFSLGDTSGGAKGGSGGTTSCWVMTYNTQVETPQIDIAQPSPTVAYKLNESDATTNANYTCTAVSTGAGSSVGPYLTIPATLPAPSTTPACSGTVPTGMPFDTSTVGPHSFTVQVQDSALNTNTQTITYTVVAAPVISGISSATFEVGTPNSVTFSATGYPAPSFVETGALPAGVSFIDNKNGTATLSGTAAASGIFAITISATNTAGTATPLAFTVTAASLVPTASGKCNGLYNGTFKGNLTVSAGQTCTFVGGGVTGNVVENGGKINFTNSAVGGSTQVNGGTFSIGPAVTIKGNLSVLEPSRSTVQSQVCGANIGANLQVLESAMPIAIGNGTSTCPGNVITGNLNVSENNAAVAIYNNTVGGSLLDLGNAKPTQIFSNSVKGLLTCLADSGITGGSNTALLKLGQCSKF